MTTPINNINTNAYLLQAARAAGINLTPTTTNNSSTLTPNASTLAPVAGVDSNPLALLASLGNAPTQGVAAVKNFEQTLALALSSIMSNTLGMTSDTGGSDESGSDSKNVVPDYGKNLMTLQIQMALSNLQHSAQSGQTGSNGGTNP